MAYDLKDYQKDESFGLLDKGDYEVTLEKIEIKQAQSGNDYANFTYRVRSDVDQKFKNRILFDTIFQEKDATGKPNGYFNRARITKIIKAIFPKDTPLVFNSVDDIFETIIDHKLVVNVNQRHDDFRDEDVNYIAYFKPSQHGDKEVQKTAPAPQEPSPTGETKVFGKKDENTDVDDFYETSKKLASEEDLPF